MTANIDLSSLSAWKQGVDAKLFDNEVGAMIKHDWSGNGIETAKEASIDLHEILRDGLLLLFQEVFTKSSTSFRFEIDSSPSHGLDLLIHQICRWESEKKRLVPLLVLSWRDRKQMSAMMRDGSLLSSYTQPGAYVSFSPPHCAEVVQLLIEELSENFNRITSIVDHPHLGMKHLTADWKPSIIVPLYPNGIPTTPNTHLTCMLKAMAKDEKHFRRLTLEHSLSLLNSPNGIVTTRFFIKTTSTYGDGGTALTQLMSTSGDDELLKDRNGRVYIFEDREEAGAFALKMDCYDVRGLGDDSWKKFKTQYPYTLIPKDSAPKLIPSEPISQTLPSDPIAEASTFKDAGNAELKTGNLEKATQAYVSGIKILEGYRSLATPPKLQPCLDLLVILYSNKAQVHLQQGACGQARDAAEMALRVNPLHGKSIVRYVRALHRLGSHSMMVSKIRESLELALDSDVKVALKQIMDEVLDRDRPLPQACGANRGHEDYLEADDILGAIMRGLAEDSSFITYSFVPMNRAVIERGIAGDSSPSAGILRAVLAIESGHDKKSNVPFSLLNPGAILTLLDAVLASKDLAVQDKIHALHLRGVVQYEIRDYALAAKDLEEAYRLSRGQEPWILLWCGRANVDDTSPPSMMQATAKEREEHAQRSYARSIRHYEMLIAWLERAKEEGCLDPMLVFARWELAYAHQCSLFSERCFLITEEQLSLTDDKCKKLMDPAVWEERVLPLAERAIDTEKYFTEKLPSFHGIINCIAKDYVSEHMALSRSKAQGAKDDLRDGAAVEIFGLTSRKDLNGKHGRIDRFDAGSQRFVVGLPDRTSIRVRRANLKFLRSRDSEQAEQGPPGSSTQPKFNEQSNTDAELHQSSSSIEDPDGHKPDSLDDGVSRVLDAFEARSEMQEAGIAEERRKAKIAEAIERGDLPDMTLGPARIHKMLKEESQAMNQRWDAYHKRQNAQDMREKELHERAQKLSYMQQRWKNEISRREKDTEQLVEWAMKEVAEHEDMHQKRIEELESKKNTETRRLNAEIGRLQQEMKQAEDVLRTRIENAESDHRQVQEALEVILNEREDFECETMRRRNRANQEWRRVQQMQHMLEQAEADLLQQRQDIKDKELHLNTKKQEVDERRKKLNELQTSLGFHVGSPSHWTQSPRDRGLAVVLVTDPVLLGLLQSALHCQNASEWLGQGADVREGGQRYNYLALKVAWRVQNLPLWHKYCVEISKMQSELVACGVRAPRVEIRAALHDATKQLPGPTLNQNLNETFLLHGTEPGTVLPLLQNGFNERFNSRAAFGFGSYLAEDAGKCDQYLTKDAKYDSDSPLHQMLFCPPPSFMSRLLGETPLAAGTLEHPGDVYWIVLARNALGYAARSLDTHVETNSGGPVWVQPKGRAAQFRELACVPNVTGSVPSVAGSLHYHSLVLGVSDESQKAQHTTRRVYRYREFIFPHSYRIYPEYLLAVKRVWR